MAALSTHLSEGYVPPPTTERPSDTSAALAEARVSSDRWPWAVGVALGLAVLGPGLGGGSLLSLDLLVTPHIPVPNGLYGLGPALSQRVPSFAVLALVALVVGGPVATKLAIVGMVAAAFVGASRLVGRKEALLTRLAAGVLWAAGPFTLTRIGVGHLNVVWAIAVLPWVLPRLCRPSEAPRRTFLAMLLLAFGGPASGTLGAAVAVVALLVERRRRPVVVLSVVAVANLLWILPTAVLLWAGAQVTGAGGFATHARGPGGWLSVLTGDGFWRADFQAGPSGIGMAVAGVAIAVLAWFGRRRLDPGWARPATVVALVGLALSLASTVPGVRAAYRWASDLSVGAPLRESHRFLALWLVVAAPASALGGAELARRLASDRGEAPGSAVPGRSRGAAAGVFAAVPLALALAIGAPAWWGIEGRLEPVTFPHGWSLAKDRIAEHPGPTVALPWSEYPPIPFAGGRQAFNPVPDYIGGDVISSYDPVFHPGRSSQEQVDRRSVTVDRLTRRIRRGEPMGAQFGRAGIRWLLVVHQGGWEQYRSLASDPGLRLVLHDPDVDLYTVRSWRGPAEAADGRAVALHRPLPPILTTDAGKGAVLDVAGAPGWVQGWSSPARVTTDGRLRLTGSGGVIWFWPAPVLLVGDVVLAGAALWAYRTRNRANPPETGDPSAGPVVDPGEFAQVTT
jgi:hypothetical protein